MRFEEIDTAILCVALLVVAEGALNETRVAQDARSRFIHERSKCLGWHLRSGDAGNYQKRYADNRFEC